MVLACDQAHNPIDLSPYVEISTAVFPCDLQGGSCEVAGFASKSGERKKRDGYVAHVFF